MSLLLMSSASRMNKIKSTNNATAKEDVGTCKNCVHQGNCPYTDGTCTRAYYHKIYSDKKEKSVDKFKLK